MSQMIATDPFGLELFVTAQYPVGLWDDIEIYKMSLYSLVGHFLFQSEFLRCLQTWSLEELKKLSIAFVASAFFEWYLRRLTLKRMTHTNQASHPIPTSSQSLTPMSAFHILRLRWQQWGWRQGGGLWGVKSGWPKVWVNQIRKGSFGSPHILAFHYPSEGFCITTF